MVDGPSSKWCKLMLLDALTFALMHDHMRVATKRSFNHHQLLYNCIQNELCRVIPESIQKELTIAVEMQLLDLQPHLWCWDSQRPLGAFRRQHQQIQSLLPKIKLAHVEKPWVSVEDLQEVIHLSPPNKSRGKYLLSAAYFIAFLKPLLGSYSLHEILEMAVLKIAFVSLHFHHRSTGKSVDLAPLHAAVEEMMDSTSSACSSYSFLPHKHQNIFISTCKRKRDCFGVDVVGDGERRHSTLVPCSMADARLARSVEASAPPFASPLSFGCLSLQESRPTHCSKFVLSKSSTAREEEDGQTSQNDNNSAMKTRRIDFLPSNLFETSLLSEERLQCMFTFFSMPRIDELAAIQHNRLPSISQLFRSSIPPFSSNSLDVSQSFSVDCDV
eukprot:scaffold847_cov172-Ochromonas_danica.AAC.13